MWLGSTFDRLAQQRIFAERNWIDAQPGLVAQGRAICLFDAQDHPLDYLMELVERFYRVFVFVAPGAHAEWARATESAGHKVYPLLVLVGREENLETCRRLALQDEPRLRGASIVHLDGRTNPHRERLLQDLYAATDMIPLPGYFVAGGDETVLTSLLLDEDDHVIGATTYHHLVRVGAGFGVYAYGLNAAVRPVRTRACRPATERARASSLAAWLNASAILRSRDMFGVREIWSCLRANNHRSIAFHRELGARQSNQFCCFCAEHRSAGPDARLTGNRTDLLRRPPPIGGCAALEGELD